MVTNYRGTATERLIFSDSQIRYVLQDKVRNMKNKGELAGLLEEAEAAAEETGAANQE